MIPTLDAVEETLALATAYVEYAREKHYTRVCWKALAGWDVWLLGMAIVNQSYHLGYPIYGSYDLGEPKKHGNKQRFQGYPPIPRRTLYV